MPPSRLTTLSSLEIEVEDLRNEFVKEIDYLRSKLNLPSLSEEEEARAEAFSARIDARQTEHLERNSISAAVGYQIEHQRQAAKQWLAACEVPEDADEYLIRVALGFAHLADSMRTHISKTAVFAAGKKPADVCGLADVIKAWPKVPEAQRVELANVAERQTV